MTDSHCHIPGSAERHFVCLEPGSPPPQGGGFVLFFGYHPWRADAYDGEKLRAALAEHPGSGIGEIGLDRLRDKAISEAQRDAFREQLSLAEKLSCAVTLHGTKCWGEVVKACVSRALRIPAFLFHGFSRSTGLVSDIARINGFISIGPALLNSHAVNYREMAAALPAELLLVETDRTEENAASVPGVDAIASELAKLRGVPEDEIAAVLEENATRFIAAAGLTPCA